MSALESKMIEDEDAFVHDRNELVLKLARGAGFFETPKAVKLSGRFSEALVAAAKKKAHVESNTELLEIALSRLALEDDFGRKVVAKKGLLPESVELEF
jgi:hypothetical protein